MSNQLLKNWQEAKRAKEEFIQWNNLPNGQKYMNDNFDISILHCTPPVLQRAGQQYQGGKNYWETSKEVGMATLEYLAKNWEDHFPKILEILEKKERENLLECQKFIDEMTEKINNAKGE